jgi:phage shock protein A
MSDPPEPIDAETETTETEPAPSPPVPEHDERDVPGLAHVRDRIEGRHAAALGESELAQDTAAARTAAEQQAEREAAGRARLAEIRRSIGL